MGGAHVWTNVVTACPQCNHRKGGRRVEESHMRLTHSPKEPPANAAYIFGKHLHEYREWEPYINGW
jgi:5-methylcytosine-specific restriction endonuclease McrA